MEVPKPIRHAIEPTLCLAFALYLGVAFSDVFLKALLPVSLTEPSVVLSGIGFFFVLRWLKQKEPQAALPTTEYGHSPVQTPAQQGFVMWESLYHPTPLLEARALSELIALLEQSRHPQQEQFDSIVALASQKSKCCASPKGDSLREGGDFFNLDNDSHI